MVLDRVPILHTGTEVMLRTRLVDPRDFLRGDCVSLAMRFRISRPEIQRRALSENHIRHPATRCGGQRSRSVHPRERQRVARHQERHEWCYSTAFVRPTASKVVSYPKAKAERSSGRVISARSQSSPLSHRQAARRAVLTRHHLGT
jgi:uncharacterized membrane-anchored protein